MSHDHQDRKERLGRGVLVGLGALVAGVVFGRLRRALRWPRMRDRRWRRLGIGLVVVLLSVTTCSVGVDTAKLTSEWGDPVPTSTEDAARVLTRGVEALRRAAESGAVRFTMTESEATSALSIGLMMSDLMQVAGRIPQEEIQRSPDLEALRAGRIPQEEIQRSPDLEALRERIWKEADLHRRELAGRSGLLERLLMKLDPRIRTGDVQVRFEPTGEVVAAGYVQAWRFRQPGVFVLAPSARDGELRLAFLSGRLGRLPLPAVVFNWFGGIVARGIMLGQRYAEVSEITVGDGTFTFAARLAD